MENAKTEGEVGEPKSLNPVLGFVGLLNVMVLGTATSLVRNTESSTQDCVQSGV